MIKYIFALLSLLSLPVHAEELLTNSAVMADPPKWVSSTRINRIADDVQSTLEWTIRRVRVIWHKDQAAFEKVHGLGALPRAVADKKANTIHLGPNVNEKNFDQSFGHELVHIIAYQKYKQAIPAWLEEGLANDLVKNGKVDYAWLATQELPGDVRTLTHPFSGGDAKVRFHYQASQALAEMLKAKCDFRNLLRLSVGEKMEPYIDTFCGIKDLSGTFRTWVQTKAKSSSVQQGAKPPPASKKK